MPAPPGSSRWVREGSQQPARRRAWRPRPRASGGRDRWTSRRRYQSSSNRSAGRTDHGPPGPSTPTASSRRHAAAPRARYARRCDPCRGARDPDRSGTDPSPNATGHARPGPPRPERHRGEPPPRRHRRGGRDRSADPIGRRSRPGRDPALHRQAVRGRRADRGRRDRRVRSRAARDRDHGELPFRRGLPRPDAPGHVPASRREPGDARLWQRGDAARPAHRGPPGARRREAGPDPPHVLGPARGLAAPVAAEGLGPRDVLGAGPPIAGHVPGSGRAGVRHDAGPAPDSDRWLRRRDLRVPPSRGRPGVRVPGRAIGRRAAGPASLDRAGAHDRPGRDRGEPGDDRRPARQARYIGHEGRRGSAHQQGRYGGAPADRHPAWAALAGRSSTRRPASPSRSRMATATIEGPGQPRSRRFVRSACSTASPSGSSRATTGRRSSTRMGGSGQNRSRTSSLRRSAN